MRRTLTVLAALALTAFTVPAAATEPDPVVTVEVAWLMPTPAGGWSAPPTAATATWPQTLTTLATCGDGWVQLDVYRGPQSVIDAILADGVLSNDGRPEDHAVVVSWRFVPQPACEVPDPPVVVDPPAPEPPQAVPATPVPHAPAFTG